MATQSKPVCLVSRSSSAISKHAPDWSYLAATDAPASDTSATSTTALATHTTHFATCHPCLVYSTTTTASATSFILTSLRSRHHTVSSSSGSLLPIHTTTCQPAIPHTKHSTHSNNLEAWQSTLRQQPLTWQPPISPNPTHSLESGTQRSWHGSATTSSVLPASPRSRRIFVEIAECWTLHGTHSHEEYSRKRTDVHAFEEHEREEPVHRRHGTITSWTCWSTRPIQERPGHPVHATAGRQHCHPSSIDTTTPSQGTTTAPDSPASGSASQTDWKASNSRHPPHTREDTAPPFQDHQSLHHPFGTIPFRTNATTPHTTIPWLPSRDTVPITGIQSITTYTRRTGRDHIPSNPKGHNQSRTQEKTGIIPANTTLTIPPSVLQATPTCGPTSFPPCTVSQSIANHPPSHLRCSQLSSHINATATSSHTTPRTGDSHPAYQTLEYRRTPYSLQRHQNPKVDRTAQQPRAYRTCQRDHRHSCQDPEERTAQLGRDSSTLWLTYGRSHFDDLQDLFPVLRSRQSLGSLTSTPTPHHTTPNIPTSTTSQGHSHHSPVPGTPHTPPPSHWQTPPYLHPWPSPSHMHLSLLQHLSTSPTLEAILSATSHHTWLLHPLSHATNTRSLHQTSIPPPLTPNIPPDRPLLHWQHQHWYIQARIQPTSQTQTTPWTQDTPRGTSPTLVAHQSQLPTILHTFLT